MEKKSIDDKSIFGKQEMFFKEKQERRKEWSSSVFFESKKIDKSPSYLPHTTRDLSAKATIGSSLTARSFEMNPLERIELNYNQWQQDYQEKIAYFNSIVKKLDLQDLENSNSEILADLENFAKKLSGQQNLSRIKSPIEYLKIIIDALSGEFIYFQKIKNDGLAIDESLFFLAQQSEDIKFIQKYPSTALTLDKVYKYKENYFKKIEDLIMDIQNNQDILPASPNELLELTADRLILEKIELAQGTRNRAEIFKNFTKQAMNTYFKETINPKEPFVILEIAAGTAFSTTQALKEFIKENSHRIKNIEDLNIKIILIDIDNHALNEAVNNLSSVLSRGRGQDKLSDKIVTVKPDNGRQIFKRNFISQIFENLKLSGANRINISGLLDYLSEQSIIRLLSNVNSVRKKNGQMMISNVTTFLPNQYKSKPILEKNEKGEGGLLNWLPMIDRSADKFTKITKEARLNIKKQIITQPPSYTIIII